MPTVSLLSFLVCGLIMLKLSFFFIDTATTEIYTLSLHDALPIFRLLKRLFVSSHLSEVIYVWCYCWRYCTKHKSPHRSEERFSRNAETDLVCRLLLEKKKKTMLKYYNTENSINKYTDLTHLNQYS